MLAAGRLHCRPATVFHSGRRWLAERRGPPGREAQRSYEPQPIATLVWVDADDRIRRISYQRSILYTETGVEPGWEILELWDFGTEVEDAFPF